MNTRKADTKSSPACSYGPPAWHYVCQECGHEFDMPVPKGPTEAKNRACPECHSKDIKRTGTVNSEACPPGG